MRPNIDSPSPNTLSLANETPDKNSGQASLVFMDDIEILRYANIVGRVPERKPIFVAHYSVLERFFRTKISRS